MQLRRNRLLPETPLPDGTLNCSVLTGQLLERKQMRYTPAGIPVSEGWIKHRSLQMENGTERQVELEIAIVALGENARWLEAAPLGGEIKVTGFLAAKSRNSNRPVLHVNTLEYLEGNENGSILQEEG